MTRRSLIASALVLTLLGFVGQPRSARAQCVEPEGAVHEARGRVVGFVPQGGLVRIAHEEVPGVMGAMTMAFAPCPSVDITGLSVGDAVRFRFTRGPGGGLLVLSLERVERSRA